MCPKTVVCLGGGVVLGLFHADMGRGGGGCWNGFMEMVLLRYHMVGSKFVECVSCPINIEGFLFYFG